MSDLIKRSDAIEAVWKPQVKPNELIFDALKTAIESEINNAPSADRPQGEWIYCEDEYGIDGYRCSNCGRHIPWDYQHKFINFIDDYHTCPFCDARMKGTENNKECHKPESLYYRAFCEERKDSAYCDGCEFWY